ncbi:hypothetical protein INQ42_11130 [Lysobacter avium]|uniref:DUF2779 domain-containing protein n=2 Tax=Novilysobacter avium TaxID=2781023 RepID=A0A7S6ZU80_9GAMM|nr:hypothetical protein INQ42_11130 [Lysobacter avium]
MAKQVLLAARQLDLPVWERIAHLSDLDHQLHQETLERPGRSWEYAQAKEEEWMAGMRPDVVLEDEHPTTVPLLVEVKVSHAVGHEKAALVRKRGWAMIEIDLSKLDADAVLGDAFERAVLQDAPRFWIHSPTAERLFEQVQAKVEQQVANRNALILAERARRDAERRSSEAKLDADRRRKERFRQKLRARHLPDLEALKELSSPAAAREQLTRLAERDALAIDLACRRYLGGAPLPPFLTQIPTGWQLIDTHPHLWQLKLWGQFVCGQPVGTRLKPGKWVPHLGRMVGFNAPLKRLFDAQQQDWQQARAKGFRRSYPYSAWFFEDWENELIPSPFDLIGDLADQLWAASLLELQERGVYEVISTEPDLAAFEPDRRVQPATPSPPPASPRDNPRQTHERVPAEELLRLEERGEPYNVCVICEMPFRSGDRCRCGTKLRPRIVRASPPYPR